jgi:hypothetical protein
MKFLSQGVKMGRPISSQSFAKRVHNDEYDENKAECEVEEIASRLDSKSGIRMCQIEYNNQINSYQRFMNRKKSQSAVESDSSDGETFGDFDKMVASRR